MKTLSLVLMIVSLVCALSLTCAAVTLPFSDDFEGPSHPLGSNDSQHWDIQAQPGPNGEPPVNSLNWQIVDMNDNNVFTCLDQGNPQGDPNNVLPRGFVTVKGVSTMNFFEEVDAYNVDGAGETALSGAAISTLAQLPQCAVFVVNGNAWGGAMYFYDFGWNGADPNGGAFIGPTMLQGVFPYLNADNPTNRIHLTLTAQGLTWTGTVQGYDAGGNLTCTGTATHTWLAGLPAGGIGLMDNTPGMGFDNYHAEVYVPEPGSMACLSMGLLGAIGMIRRRR